jgi:hypothetical protein
MPDPLSEIDAALARMPGASSGKRPDSAGPGTPKDVRVPTGYAALTRTATYGFLAALPLVVLYEVLAHLTLGATGVRVSADVWIKGLLASVDATGGWLFAAVVVALGAALILRERRRYGPLPLRGAYFAGMLAESTGLAVVLAFAVSAVVGMVFAQAGGKAIGLSGQLALSLGAGIYEELVFRVILVGGLAWGLRRVWTRTPAYLVAAVVGALVFSAIHYVGPYGDAFTLPSFTFRALFGLALNAVFLLRGFGIAAWTHAIYDVLVTVKAFG